MSITVVVDGGGSGCRLRAYDADGVIRASATDGPASLSLGVDQTWKHIQSGLRSIALELGEPEDWLPSRLYMGLAGALQKKPRERFLAKIPATVSSTLITDGHGQLLGAIGGSAGICLAVGTGSVMYWQDKMGKIGKAGGWGFPMGDEASGAWLGAKLISAYLWHRDTTHSNQATPMVFQQLEKIIGTVEADIQTWSTQTQSTKLAGLAPVVVSAAEKGDDIAENLLLQGSRYCEKLIALAPKDIPLYMVGGLSKIYRVRLNQQQRNRCCKPCGDALTGLYSLAQTNTGSQS